MRRLLWGFGVMAGLHKPVLGGILFIFGIGIWLVIIFRGLGALVGK